MAGLGDLVYYILKYTGIHGLHHYIYYNLLGYAVPCGCKSRRAWLNRKFPFRRIHGN